MRKKKLKVIKFFILSILALFLVFYFSVWIHEFSHKFIYRNIEKTNESICVMGITYHYGNNSLKFEKCMGLFGHYNLQPTTLESYTRAMKIYKNQEIFPDLIQSAFLVILYYLIIKKTIKFYKENR